VVQLLTPGYLHYIYLTWSFGVSILYTIVFNVSAPFTVLLLNPLCYPYLD